eukprot:3255661-Alexandrium_andersonii.AAC.1
MSASLVGSEMCIRDRRTRRCASKRRPKWAAWSLFEVVWAGLQRALRGSCLLYTSDAADDM